ncbi:MAG: ParB/RepB/Spo0J family partition protein [Opitutia bacterium]|jgi:ParB family chromosome partitioning protein
MSQPKKSSLGRGLGSLIGAGAGAKPAVPAPAPVTSSTPAPVQPAGIQDVPVAQVAPNPRQPRREFDQRGIEELAESIRAEGLMQPIVVRKVPQGFELIAGERRLRAFRHLGIKVVPARVLEVNDAASAVLALVENLQRADLNPVDEALGVASLMRDFKLTQDAVADRLGKPRATVANSVRLLQLDREVLGYLSKGQLSAGHAKVLLGLEQAAQQVQAARRIVQDELSVRATEKLVRQLQAPRPGDRRRRVAQALEDVQRRLTTHLAAPVQVQRRGAKGVISIRYSGDEDLQRILEKLGLKAG